MLRTFVNGKIHQLKVTGLQPKYSGSCLICPELLAAAGIEPFEKVEIYSLTSTARGTAVSRSPTETMKSASMTAATTPATRVRPPQR